GLGNDVEKKVRGTKMAALRGILRHRARIQSRRIDVHPTARLKQLGDAHADQQRQCCYCLEVEERLQSHTAQLARVSHTGNADHNAQEDDGGDEHADELDEAVAEGLEILRKLGIEDARENAEDDADQHPEVE